MDRGGGECPMVQKPASSRRKYLRIPTDQVISFAEIDRPDQLAVSRDVSTGGIRFEAVGCEINLGDRLRVTFNVGRRTIIATGRVIWAVETDPITQEVGIEFDEIDPAALRYLEEAIEPALESPGPY
ncbi:MAG: PilZ domain-containing protein [Deltaproteobacteria bacterium]|nr:PilZ domain-containing protein [Deltaproteobacteria bacterium]